MGIYGKYRQLVIPSQHHPNHDARQSNSNCLEDMARNIEIKAHANDFHTQLAQAQSVCEGQLEVLRQTDTFFAASQGRLKLREFPDRNAQLIFYHRVNQDGPKLSDYHITNTADAEQLKHTLSETMGVLAVVKKKRTLLMHGRTRLHFDEVEGLGQFLELEVVLNDDESIEQGELEAKQLMRLLSISDQDLIDRAYVDLLIDAANKPANGSSRDANHKP